VPHYEFCLCVRFGGRVTQPTQRPANLLVDVYLAEEDSVAALWRDAPVVMFVSRTPDISVAMEVLSKECHHIRRRPLGLLQTSTGAPPVVTILVQHPSAEYRLYKAEQLLHVGFQVVTEMHRLVVAVTQGAGHHMVRAPPVPGQGGGRLHHFATSAASTHIPSAPVQGT